MKSVNPFSQRIGAWVAFFMLLACLAVDSGVYWTMKTVLSEVQLLGQRHPAVAEIGAVVRRVEAAGNLFWPYFVPASILFFGLLALLLWLVLRRAVSRRTSAPTEPLPADTKDAGAGKTKEDKVRHQRTYLHLITVLQREGRLMDFLSEDLAQYADAQIGVAVRNIHENCKKSIEKHLAPRSVLDQDEGAEITVEADFDPNALKLVGNVTGQPPFKGVVRHRGWRAGKIEPPTFSGRQDPGIIAPAEVEVH